MNENKPKKTINFEVDLNNADRYVYPNPKFKALFSSDKDSFEDYVIDYKDVFSKLSDLQNKTINNVEIRKNKVKGRRFGYSLSVDDKTKWTLQLLNRASIAYKGNKFPISQLIGQLVETSVSRPFFYSNFHDQRSYDKNLSSINEIRYKLYKVCFVKNAWSPFNPDGSHENENECLEIFLPDFTYHIVPLFKSLLLAISDPNLLDHEHGALIFQELFPSKYSDYDSGEFWTPEDTKKLVNSTDIDLIAYHKEILQKDIAKEFDEMDPQIKSFMWYQNAMTLQNISEADIDFFSERFKLAKEVMEKSGNISW